MFPNIRWWETDQLFNTDQMAELFYLKLGFYNLIVILTFL